MIAEIKPTMCPLSFSQPGAPLPCIGGECMLWREVPRSSGHAVLQLKAERTAGFCGLGGRDGADS